MATWRRAATEASGKTNFADKIVRADVIRFLTASSAMAGSDKIVRVPIHGFVKLSPWEQDVIDHRVFQRLRHVRQLALTEMVYPGACHSRFEHSLGVMQVASMMFDQLRPQLETSGQLEPRFSKDDLEKARVIVRLSALLHDVGHCPFSHAGEDVMPTNPLRGKKHKHEDYSAALIRHCMGDVIDGHPANELKVSADEICTFLQNDGSLPLQLLFWRPLITGQMDADRADYLLRDSHHAGVAYGQYDINRLVATLRVVRDRETENLMIGIETGGIQAVEGLILARYMMFIQVYFHHTRRAYDRHVTGVLGHLLAQEYGDRYGARGTFPPPSGDEVRTAVQNLDEFLRWTDPRVWQAIENDSAGPHGVLIKSRHHDRRVHETSHFPSTPELDHFYEVALPKLRTMGGYVDKADNSWYKFDKSADIRVATSDRGIDPAPVPLSERSSLVRALEEVTQRRVYVPWASKEKAKRALRP
ncbi:MAG: HD domain-containing protein [Bryobacteraceae bacterium]|nr:HD domain-containing protein [Bryobacteraceae bacterium]